MPEALQPPREMNKVSLPAYRIEPPDVIQIEMLKLIPLPPYRAEIFDVLQIRANALPDQPIDNILHGRGRRHDQPGPDLRLRPRGRHDHRRDPRDLEQVAAASGSANRP